MAGASNLVVWLLTSLIRQIGKEMEIRQMYFYADKIFVSKKCQDI